MFSIFYKSLLALLALLLLVWALFTPINAERYFGVQQSSQSAGKTVDAEAQQLHPELFIADLHADSLMWTRDLVEQSKQGQLDFPRMIEGNMGLQLFMAVTDAPFDPYRSSIEKSFDQLGLLAFLDNWPVRSWFSPKARALHAASRLQSMASQSEGQFRLITDRDELTQYRHGRDNAAGITAGWLGIEGAEPLEGSIDNLETLYAAGYRLMGLAHFWDSHFSGSSSGAQKSGLSAAGRQLIQEMETLGMTVDVAHASEQAAIDILQITTKPVIASHVGIQAICDRPQNLSDVVIDGIAANGGVIGIAFYTEATCSDDLHAVIDGIRYVRDRVGAQHVALGSGFDTPVAAPIQVTDLPRITDALLADGFSREEIALVMGENIYRLLSENLPATSRENGNE